MAEERSRSELRNIIGETSACVDFSCKGWLVDSFSGRYWIKCSDPKHNANKIAKRSGEFNKVVKVAQALNHRQPTHNHDSTQPSTEHSLVST